MCVLKSPVEIHRHPDQVAKEFEVGEARPEVVRFFTDSVSGRISQSPATPSTTGGSGLQ
jgi:hypothetical protein